jgi:hypothetical protein
MQGQPPNEPPAPAFTRDRVALVVLTGEANVLNAANDRLAQIAANLVATGGTSAAV